MSLDSPDPTLFRIDIVCEQFEDSLAESNSPRIEDYLANWKGTARRLLFGHLLELELDYRIRSGESPRLQDYLDRFPEYESVVNSLTAPAENGATPRAAPQEKVTRNNPAQIGDYAILGEIGRGGMGVVFEARQRSLDRRVALKILPDGVLHDPIARERFRREAKAAAGLHHTNIVPVFEVGEDQGVYFYAMQFIDGESLDKIVTDLRSLRDSRQRPNAAANPREAREESRSRAATTSGAGVTGAVESHNTGVPVHFKLASDQPSELSKSETQTPRDPLSETKVDHALLLSRSNRWRLWLDMRASSSSLTRHFRSVADLGIQIAEALAYAHERGIIHRDIKPSNLLLDRAGAVWLTDFGLAKIEGDAFTKTGDVLGTLQYMPPERFRGHSDARGDIYSLGATLYELISLRPPYAHVDPLKLIDQIARSDPPMLRSLNPLVPRDLDTIILKAIEKDPNRRYQSAADLAADLRRFVEDIPIESRRVSAAERLGRWARRNKAIATSLTSTLLLLVLGVVGLTLGVMYFRVQEREQRGLAETNKVLARKHQIEREKAEQRADTIQRNLYCAEMNLAGAAIDIPSGLHRVRELLFRWVDEDPARELRGWEWYHLRSRLERAEATLKGFGARRSLRKCIDWNHDGSALAVAAKETIELRTGRFVWRTKLRLEAIDEINCIDWSGSGERLAAGTVDGRLVIWNLDTEERRLLKPVTVKRISEKAINTVAWSPDETVLATASVDELRLRIWDSSSLEETQTFEPGSGPFLSGCWSNDGARIAAVGDGGAGNVFDLSDAGVTVELQLPDTVHYCVAWSPDDRHVAIGGLDNVVRIFDPHTGKEVRSFKGHAYRVYGVDWSADSRFVVSASEDRTLRVWDTKGEEPTAILREHSGIVTTVDWSPTGKLMASASLDGTVRIWDVDGRPEVPDWDAAVWRDSHRALCWSPDGARLATTSVNNRVLVWSAETGELAATMLGHSHHINNVVWSPDGRYVASSGWDSTVQVWQSADGSQLHRFATAEPVLALDWSPDGRWLAGGEFGGKLHIWDIGSGELQCTLGGLRYYTTAAWSPDGQRLAAGDYPGLISVWNPLEESKLLEVQSGAVELTSIAWSPDGNQFAQTGRTARIVFWDALSGRKLQTMVGHTDMVRYLSWHPWAPRMASASYDGSIKIWDLRNHQCVLTLRGHSGQGVLSAEWSDDGVRLASVGRDGHARIWDAIPGLLRERSPQLLPWLNDQLERRPNDRRLLRMRAIVLANLRDWKNAAIDLARLANLGGSDWPTLYQSDWWIANQTPAAGLLPGSDPIWLADDPGSGGEIELGGFPKGWTRLTAETDGFLNSERHQQPGLKSGFSRVFSSDPHNTFLCFGSPGNSKVWVNQELILHDLEAGEGTLSEFVVPVELRQGWNSVRVDWRAGGSAGGFYFRVVATEQERAEYREGRPAVD